MPICDICSDHISESAVNRCQAAEIINATNKGFVPSRLPMGLNHLFGVDLTPAEVWNFTVSQNRTVDWGLCNGCISELYDFLRKERQTEYIEEARIEDSRLRELGYLTTTGTNLYVEKDYTGALATLKEALFIAKELNKKDYISVILESIGKIDIETGEYKKAIRYLSEAKEAYNIIGDKTSTVNAMNLLGKAYYLYGYHDDSMKNHNEALVMANQIGDELSVGDTLNNIGVIYVSNGEYNKAIGCFQRSFDIFSRLQNKVNVGKTLYHLGEVYANLGEYNKAISHYQQSLDIALKEKDTNQLALIYANISIVLANTNYFDEALICSEKALKYDIESKKTFNMPRHLNNIGLRCLDLNQNDDAKRYFEEAVRVSRSLGQKSWISISLHNLAAVYGAFNQFKEALELESESINLQKQYINDSLTIANSLDVMATLSVKLNLTSEAFEHLNQSIMIGCDYLDNLSPLFSPFA